MHYNNFFLINEYYSWKYSDLLSRQPSSPDPSSCVAVTLRVCAASAVGGRVSFRFLVSYRVRFEPLIRLDGKLIRARD